MRWDVTELPRSVGTMLEQENETGSADADSGILELMNGDKQQCTYSGQCKGGGRIADRRRYSHT